METLSQYRGNPDSQRRNIMAKNAKNTYGNLKITDLEVGTEYPVKYSCFKRVAGSRGAFMSASFLIQTDPNNAEACAWVSTPNEKSAYKAIGCMTCSVNGFNSKVTSITPVKSGNSNYLDFEINITAYTPESDNSTPF